MSTQNYDSRASAQSLQQAGWKAKEARGMPDTNAKVRQVGYLETTAPDGQSIDLQFLEDAARAEKEMKATLAQPMSMFMGTTIGNVLVFSHPMGEKNVSAADLAALQKLLK